MNLPKSALFVFSMVTSSFAGGLNVIHLGPVQDIKCEIVAAALTQEFTLAHLNATGPFMLPQKNAVLRILGDKIKPLDIKEKKSGQIAILFPHQDTFRWHLCASKPTDGKTSLRIINLTDEATVLTIGGKKIEIKPTSETTPEEDIKSPVRITLENGKQKSHSQEEPGAVLGILYKDNDGFNILYINDL